MAVLSSAAHLFTDTQLGVSSVPLYIGQTGSDTAIKLAAAVVQGMNLHELEKVGRIPHPTIEVKAETEESVSAIQVESESGGSSQHYLPLQCQWCY